MIKTNGFNLINDQSETFYQKSIRKMEKDKIRSQKIKVYLDLMDVVPNIDSK